MSRVVLDYGVLSVLLQHPAITNHLGLVCRLMCSSKALKAAVLQYCRGMASTDIPCLRSYGEVVQVGAWLVRYGQLLQCLRSSYLKASACSVIAAGLQQAAAGPSGLHLQEVDICLHSSVAGTFVQQLPSQHMRRLVLDIHGREYSDDKPVVKSLLWPNPCYAQTCSALAGLTGLQSLELSCSVDDDIDSYSERDVAIDPYIPGIASLFQLTRLHLGPCSTPLLAKLLSAQLQTLELNVSYLTDQYEPLFQLGHLTAMSCLRLFIDDDIWDNDCDYVFKPGDVLPPNLQKLKVFDVSDANCKAVQAGAP